MDKIKQNIPVNIRVIGTPKGEEVFYFEDYVYTFLEKIVENDSNGQHIVELYGEILEENDIKCYLVSGACEENQEENIIFNAKYLGTAKVFEDKKIIIEFKSDSGEKVRIESFYIYYAQNEEMQNFLLKWNVENRPAKTRYENDNAVNFGRIASAYNKEEIRIGHLWNAVNLVCLGFVVSILAYMIVSINNYNKLKTVQQDMEYVMTVMSDYVENVSYKAESATEECSAVSVTEEMTAMSMEEFEESKSKEEPSKEERREKFYTVKQGDTLYSICRLLYGNSEKVQQICAINNIDNPDNILCGQKLLLP